MKCQNDELKLPRKEKYQIVCSCDSPAEKFFIVRDKRYAYCNGCFDELDSQFKQISKEEYLAFLVLES